jgi:hypothetical protein
MASILCRVGEKFPNSHRHDSVSGVRNCYGVRHMGLEQAVDQDIKNGNYRVHTPAPQRLPVVGAWEKVNSLRDQIKSYLIVKPSGAARGYFAINVPDGFGGAPVKFYRVTRVTSGRIFVDAQASDEYHSVKTPASLELVLGRIMGDPVKAAELYASSLGRCYRCGRTLTDETSRSVGMGPECRSKA